MLTLGTPNTQENILIQVAKIARTVLTKQISQGLTGGQNLRIETILFVLCPALDFRNLSHLDLGMPVPTERDFSTRAVLCSTNKNIIPRIAPSPSAEILETCSGLIVAISMKLTRESV